MRKPIPAPFARKSVTQDDINEIKRVFNNDFFKCTAFVEATRIIDELWAENAALKQSKQSGPTSFAGTGNTWGATSVQLARKA